MADQRIDQLNAETTPAAVDVLPVFSIAGSDTKKITVKNLIQVGATLIDNGSIPASKVNLGALNIVNASIDANAEISVSKLANGSARQLLQTDAAGTGVQFASNIDIPGTLDVTNAATFDSTVAVAGALTKSGSNVVTVGDTGTVTSAMLLDGTIVNADINANAEIAVSKLVDGTARQLLQTDAAGTDVEWASNIDIPGTLDVTNAATFDSTVAVAGALTKSGSNVVTVGDTGTVTSAMLLDGTILNADINASAAIAYSKLATLTSGNIVLGNSANVATSTAVTGDVTIGDNGATAIAAGVIVNADINASAAIAYSKLAALTSGNIVLGSGASVATSTPITGDVTISNTGVTAIAAGVIADADINASAAIVDTKLATIATALKVSNSATTATNLNTASAIVARDASGNFTAGTITAALTGTASGNLITGGALGTPSSGTLTSCTGLPISTGVSGLGTGAATFLATPSSANLAALLTDETGSGAAVFASSPTLISPALGTPLSGVLTNCTNLPIATASVVGAMLPGTGLSVTGGGVVNHINSATAGTTSGITFDAQGHITTTAALVGGDLPVATSGVIGAVRPGTGLTVDGSGILDISAATNIALGGVIAGSDFGISTGTISLATQGGLTAGTYTKATFNSKGIATGGTALVAGDIPNLAASQITSGSLDIARIATNTVTSAKLANYAVTKIGDTQPTADHIGEFFFNPLSRDLFLWDGNVYQPIGISIGEIVFAGTFDASLGSGTGLISSVTTEGTAIGLAIGQALPAPSAGNSRYYLVVAEGGTITTGNAPHVVLAPPDILLSNGITWTEIDVSQTITAQSANNISFTPAGSIVSVNVQNAIQELDGDKLPIAGGTITGNLEIGTAGSLSFEGSTTNNFETTLAVVDPTADRTITLPDTTGTVITTGDTGTVTSTMLLDGTILNADINASAAIVDTKLATITTAGKVSNSATTAASANTASSIVARDASGNFTAGTITADLTGNASTVTTNANLTGHVTSVGNAAVLGSFTSAQLLAALTDETGTGAAVFATSPTFVTPALGTPSSGTLTNCTFPTLNQNTTGNAATVTTNANLTGDVTSVGNATSIAAGVIVDADINASAGIVDTKLATIATALKVSNSATTATNANTASAIVARDASGNFTAGTITAALTGNASTVTTNANLTGDVTSTGNATAIAAGVIVNADVNASAAIAGSKIAPDFGAQTITTTGVISPALGTAALPSVAFTGDLNTGIFSPGADQVAISSNGVQRINIEADGDINIDGGGVFYDATNNRLAIGTTSPATTLDVNGDVTITDKIIHGGDTNTAIRFPAADTVSVETNGSERARIDSSGRLLVGTSSAFDTSYIDTNYQIGIEKLNTYAGFAMKANFDNADGCYILLAKSRGSSLNTKTVVNDGDNIGAIVFEGADGTNMRRAAQITCLIDGTPGADDMPGRMEFATTADGAANPTERMRINNAGEVTTTNEKLNLITVGRGAGAISTNTAVGTSALASNTTGNSNTANGVNALQFNTTGNNNTANGLNALQSNTTGTSNTANGLSALFSNTTGGNNTANGVNALFSNTTGGNNTANGLNALYYNTTGGNNTANGVTALQANTTGNNNTANGLNALQSNTTGSENTAIGLEAGYGDGTQANTTGGNNTFIGFDAMGASATASNVITLGNGSIATLRCQVTTITSLSDARDKTNITNLPAGLNFINALRPVAFDWNTRDGKKVGIPEFGFIAQELQEVQASTGITVPNLVSKENPDKLEASAGTLLPVLVNAVQELTAMVRDLQAELSILKGA